MDVNPRLLADGVHLAASSPCIGAGVAGAATRTDIDGQDWNSPPAIGCDEWQPAPVMAIQPSLQVGIPAHGLTFSVLAAGQTPFTYFWSKDGTPIQDDGHYSHSGTASLVVNHFGPADAGGYQVVVTNNSGAVTSVVGQVVIHVVDAAAANPQVPYVTWATAAATIQDAINVAEAGDIVLVTNGLYATGGWVVAGNLTNRIALNKGIEVMSVNGYKNTIIQGAWDALATNGPGAVRCAYVADGAVLTGFTLQNGATRAAGDSASGGPLESGGGVWCNSTNGMVFNCLLTNNAALFGAGLAYGTLNNSLVIGNTARYGGGGAYYGTLCNCTVIKNNLLSSSSTEAAGTDKSNARNCVVLNNFQYSGVISSESDYYLQTGLPSQSYTFSCTTPTPSSNNTGDINQDPEQLDSFHISAYSPCLGAGNAAYASGVDLDDEPWNTPPAMGCDEVVLTNLVGPLSVSITAVATNLLVNRSGSFVGQIAGRAAWVGWDLGNGVATTQAGSGIVYAWTNAGDYTVTFTAYNGEHPGGVSTNLLVHVLPLAPPQLQPSVVVSNGFQFQFSGQTNVNYAIQYATNLIPPVAWQTLQTIYYNQQGVISIADNPTNAVRYYRVLAQ